MTVGAVESSVIRRGRHARAERSLPSAGDEEELVGGVLLEVDRDGEGGAALGDGRRAGEGVHAGVVDAVPVGVAVGRTAVPFLAAAARCPWMVYEA